MTKRLGTTRPPTRRSAVLVAVGLLATLSACGDDAAVLHDPWPAPDEIAQKRMQSNCVLVDGGVKCWALPSAQDPPTTTSPYNQRYLLLLGRDQYHPEPIPLVQLGRDVVASSVDSGPHGSSVTDTRCAAIPRRGVKCWGVNEHYFLGLPDPELVVGGDPETRGDLMPYVDLGSNRDVVLVSSHCALFTDGRVKCWGPGGPSRGLGDSETRGDDPGEMGEALPYVDLGTNVHAVGLQGSDTSICIWTDEGRVKCWGNNDRGQLGVASGGEPLGDDPGEMGDALPFVDLGTDVFVRQVSVGIDHACALTDQGRVKCWGANSTWVFEPYGMEALKFVNEFGRLGLGDREDRVAPLGDELPYVDLGHDARAVAVGAGKNYTCALLDDARLKCWGTVYSMYGFDSQDDRGDEPGEMGDALPAVDFGTDATVRAFGVGSPTLCALFDDDSIVCTAADLFEVVATRDDLYGHTP